MQLGEAGAVTAPANPEGRPPPPPPPLLLPPPPPPLPYLHPTAAQLLIFAAGGRRRIMRENESILEAGEGWALFETLLEQEREERRSRGEGWELMEAILGGAGEEKRPSTGHKETYIGLRCIFAVSVLLPLPLLGTPGVWPGTSSQMYSLWCVCIVNILGH